MTIGEERDVFFGEVEILGEVILELIVKRAGVGKPAVFPDLLDEGGVILKWRERRFGDKDGGHFSCMYICVWRIWMLCE